jgi:hypothetical protein
MDNITSCLKKDLTEGYVQLERGSNKLMTLIDNALLELAG